MASEAPKLSRQKLSQLVGTNFARLYRCLDPSVVFLGQLSSVECLRHQMSHITRQPTRDQKRDALLTELQNVPDHLEESVLNYVIDALISSGQEHVANIFRQETGEVPMSDAHYDLISKRRIDLRQFLEPRDGLVDHLISSGAFSESDRKAVFGKTQLGEMADETLNALLMKSDSAFDKFVNALKETGQSHLAYMLTGVGNPPMTDEHRGMLRNKMTDLCEFIDGENGLLNELSTVVTRGDIERIRSVPDNDNVIARKLVESLLMKSDSAFQAFVDALNKTGQGHVVYILTGEGESRPVKEQHRKKDVSNEES